MQKGDVAGIVIVLVLLAGLACFFALAPKAPETGYAPVEVSGSSVTVATQGDDLTAVHVAAQVKRGGFVTLHEAIGAAPGPLVGQSAFLPPGSYPDVTIEVTGGLNPTLEYFVLMFVDDGDGVYEPGVDLPVMSDGQVIKQKLSL